MLKPGVVKDTWKYAEAIARFPAELRLPSHHNILYVHDICMSATVVYCTLPVVKIPLKQRKQKKHIYNNDIINRAIL